MTVRGTSMKPAFRDGDRVLVHRHRSLVIGQVSVVERPSVEGGWTGLPVRQTSSVCGRRWFIERIAALPGDPAPARLRTEGGAGTTAQPLSAG
ncbi:hypothetical protein IU452_24740 [Nocardia transvalensis]|nr:hypothetical protein [Nocardia transvalensis]